MERISPTQTINSLALSGVSNFIYQPNRITNAQYNYTLLQERIMNAVIYILQDAIKIRMRGGDYKQLSLFHKDLSNNDIVLEIPYRFIASKQQYPMVREACKMLAGQVVEIPYIDKENNTERVRYTGLFRADLPQNGKRSSNLKIEMDKMVAKILIEIDLVDNKKAINYTKYRYIITRKARKKFTPRIYKLLCSYRSKGRFTITVEEFKRILGIKDCYKFYRDLKKYVLLPVQEELIALNADCWFDCNENGFETRENNVVTELNFTVYSTNLINRLDNGRKDTKKLLKSVFLFSEREMMEVEGLIDNNDPILIVDKLDYLSSVIRTSKKIKYPKRFIITSLKNEFSSS